MMMKLTILEKILPGIHNQLLMIVENNQEINDAQ